MNATPERRRMRPSKRRNCVPLKRHPQCQAHAHRRPSKSKHSIPMLCITQAKKMLDIQELLRIKSQAMPGIELEYPGVFQY